MSQGETYREPTLPYVMTNDLGVSGFGVVIILCERPELHPYRG
jgi:hypothetical protein